MRDRILVSAVVVLMLVGVSPMASAKEARLCLDHISSTRQELECLAAMLEKADDAMKAKLATVRDDFEVLNLTDPESAERDAANQKFVDQTQKSWEKYVEDACALVGRIWN